MKDYNDNNVLFDRSEGSETDMPENGTIDHLYVANTCGIGIRSIGRWRVINHQDSLTEVFNDLLNIGRINQHQYNHALAVFSKYHKVVLMTEAYNDKLRVHCPYSFAFLFLSNIAGALVYKDDNKLSDKEMELYQICQQIVSNMNN